MAEGNFNRYELLLKKYFIKNQPITKKSKKKEYSKNFDT